MKCYGSLKLLLLFKLHDHNKLALKQDRFESFGVIHLIRGLNHTWGRQNCKYKVFGKEASPRMIRGLFKEK